MIQSELVKKTQQRRVRTRHKNVGKWVAWGIEHVFRNSQITPHYAFLKVAIFCLESQ